MKLVITLGLLVTALAWSNEGREWRFDWEGQAVTGLAESGSQWSAQRLHARIHLSFLSERMAVLRMQNVQLSTAHRSLSTPRTLLPLNQFEEQQLSSEQVSLLELPVRFQYHTGRVADLEFDEVDQPWSENIKRSVINMIQINLSKQESSEKLQRLSSDNEGDVITVHEKTLEGDCETVYTVVKNGDNMEVTKSINFERCTKRMDIRYNYRFGEECNKNSEDKLTTQERNTESQTVFTYKLKGTEKDFVIREVEVKSQYVFAPLNKEQQILSTYVNNKLTLIEETSTGKVEQPRGVKRSSLLYNMDTELAREQWLMTGEEKYLVKAGYPKMDNVVVAEKLIKHIVKDMKSEKNGVALHISHLMARLVEVLRMSTRTEIITINDKVLNDESNERTKELMHGVIVEALSISGSYTTLERLVEKITTKAITPVKAAELIKSLVNVRTPSVEIINILLELAKENIVLRNPILEQSVWLTTGAIMNGVCGNNEDKLALTFSNINQCTIQQKKHFIKILEDKFEQSETLYKKILALKTIANAGIDMSIYMLEKIIYDKSEQKTIRMQAIDALRQLHRQMPRKIQQILLPVYKSRSDVAEVRMTALYHIMHTLPQRMVIEQIVEQITKERNQQVASFSYTLLKELATSEHPCEKQMVEDIMVALRFIKEESLQLLTSRFAHYPLLSEMLQIGTTFNFASIFTNDSVLPKELMATLDTVYGGQWNKYFAQIGFYQQNIDKVLLKLLNKLEKSGVSETLVRGRRSSLSPVEMLRNLVQKMNIKSRRVENEKDSFALIYIRHKNLDYAVVPIDEKTINQVVTGMINKGSFDFEEIWRVLSEGYRFRTQIASFVHESSRVIATSLGLPLKVDDKMPTVAVIEGLVKFELSGETIRMQLTSQPSVASTHVVEMQLMAPFVNSGAKLIHSAQMNVPIDASVELNWNKRVQMKTIIKTPNTEKRLFVFNTRPSTYLRVIDVQSRMYPEPTEKTVVIRKLERNTVNYNKVFGQELFGLEWNVIGSIPRHMIEERSLQGLLMGENHIEISVRSTDKTPREYVVEFETSLEQTNINEQPRFERFHKTNRKNFFETEKTELFDESEDDRITSFTEYTKNVQFDKAYKNRVFVKVYAVGGEKKRSGQMELRTVCDNEIRFCKVDVNARRVPMIEEDSDWELKASAQILYPRTAMTLKQLKEQKHREVQAELNAEWGTQRKNSVSLRMQGEQTTEMKQWMRMVDREIEAISEYELLKQAAQLNQYKVIVDYELSPYYKLVVEKIFGLVKAYNYLRYTTMPVTNEHGRVYTRLSVDPETRRYLNISIETPEQKFEMSQIRSPLRLPLLNIARYTPFNKIQKLAIRAECEVKSNKIRTFDNLLYKTPLTSCYSVLAKDCSEEPEFAVLLKKINKLGDEKKIKIVSEENVIEIEMIDEVLMCSVNGKRITDEGRLQEFNIEKVHDKLYIIELPQLIVKFDGYTAQIKMSHLLQNQQCGLCGHFDGQNDNEFRRADNIMTEDIEEFHRSYLSRDEECEIEESELSKKKNYKIYDIEESEKEWNTWEDKETLKKRSDDFEESETEPVEKTLIKETPSHVCFSMELVPQCRAGQQAVNTKTFKARFGCVTRSDRNIVKMKRDARLYQLDMSDIPVSYAESMQVPTACIVY